MQKVVALGVLKEPPKLSRTRWGSVSGGPSANLVGRRYKRAFEGPVAVLTARLQGQGADRPAKSAPTKGGDCSAVRT